MDRRRFLDVAGKTAAGIVVGAFGGVVWADNRAEEDIDQIRAEYESRLSRERAKDIYSDKIREGSHDIGLAPGEHQAYQFEEPGEERHQLRFVVISDFPIDALVMQDEEYEKYRDDQSGGADTFSSSLATMHGTSKTRFNQAITLVIDNTSKFEADPPPNPHTIGVAFEVWE